MFFLPSLHVLTDARPQHELAVALLVEVERGDEVAAVPLDKTQLRGGGD